MRHEHGVREVAQVAGELRPDLRVEREVDARAVVRVRQRLRLGGLLTPAVVVPSFWVDAGGRMIDPDADAGGVVVLPELRDLLEDVGGAQRTDPPQVLSQSAAP